MSELVQLPYGTIQGFVDTCPAAVISPGLSKATGTLSPCRKWLGLPYGNARRWELPRVPTAWEGVRECFEFGPACPQPWSPIQELLKAKHNPGSIDRTAYIPMSEDECLNCNIFAPSSAVKRPVPVMVWVHGGALTTGRSDDFLYDPTQMVRDAEANGTPIIVVTLNYRLNLFGWLSHPDLGLEGNFGWHDQLLLLRFVNQNIHLFGGDPSRVTLFGESAGGASVAGMATRKLSEPGENLFQRGVMQSGTPFTMAARPPGYNGYDLLIKHFNIAGSTPSERVEQLRKVSAEDLVAFLPKVKPRPSGWQWVPTIQTTEDATWPFSSGAAFAKGKWDPALKELMIGNTGDEGSLFIGRYGVGTPEGLRSFIETCFPDPQRRKEVEDLYPVDDSAKATSVCNSVGAQLVNDQLFDGPALHLLNSLASTKNATSGELLRTYAYSIRQSFPDLTNNPNLGAHHILDVPLIMRTVSLWPEGSDVDLSSKAISSRWARFAQGEGFPGEEWPAFTKDETRWFVFNEGGETGLEETKQYKPERMKFWKAKYARRAIKEGWLTSRCLI